MGAKLIGFSGWELPLHFGSQIEEHHQVRQHCGMFDISHLFVVDLVGAGVCDLLGRVLARDIKRLKTPGQGFYSLMLNESAGIVDDAVVFYLEPERYRLIANAATEVKDLAWLYRNVASGSQVEVVPRRDLAIVSVQGPEARAAIGRTFPELAGPVEALSPFYAVSYKQYFISRTGYTGEDGIEILLPSELVEACWDSLLAAGVLPAGLGARDTLRLEAGMSLYGQDMDESTAPGESGLAWAVDGNGERNFIGKSALTNRPIMMQMLGLVMIESGMLRTGQNVRTELGMGWITSGSYSPTMNKSIALSRLPVGVVPGKEVSVEIRGKILHSLTVRYPFVRNGRVLVRV